MTSLLGLMWQIHYDNLAPKTRSFTPGLYCMDGALSPAGSRYRLTLGARYGGFRGKQGAVPPQMRRPLCNMM